MGGRCRLLNGSREWLESRRGTPDRKYDLLHSRCDLLRDERERLGGLSHLLNREPQLLDGIRDPLGSGRDLLPGKCRSSRDERDLLNCERNPLPGKCHLLNSGGIISVIILS
ncbi:MAG TPA: hypothetical protein VK530_13015 [Candidatus Acidoferrum sp.]|nr:hypothetical protein [Candidatus Acidoferrum sp.]